MNRSKIEERAFLMFFELSVYFDILDFFQNFYLFCKILLQKM